MRYSLEPRYRRYVQGQGFMSFARNIGNKYGKKIFDKRKYLIKDFLYCVLYCHQIIMLP